MSLSQNIRNRRQELKLSQEYIADRLGVSRQAVSKWETGRSEPTASNLVELAALFEVSISELVGPRENNGEQPAGMGQAEEKQPNLILRRNLSLLALSFQAGTLHSCTQIAYVLVDGQRVPDYRFALVKLVLLFLCSLWMARNLLYEKDLKQRRKNSRFELVYCCVQLVVAFFTYRFKMGLVGLAMNFGVLLFYVLHINPRYMNRPFDKKRFFAAIGEPNIE